MSKDSSDQLFLLIKSLGRSEKRYFKLWVQRNAETQTKYYSLFESIDGQERFDQQAILKSEKSIKAQQLPNLKAHLYKRLLQALRQFELDKTEEIQLREYIDYIQVLYNRGLYKQCEDMIKKTGRKIEKSGHLELKLELLKWEKLVLKRLVGHDYQSKVKQIISHVEDANNKINLINKINNLSVQLNALYLQHGYVRNAQQQVLTENLVNKQMPDYKENELSLYERFHLYRLLAIYYSFLEELDNSRFYAEKWLRLFTDNKSLQQNNIDDYLQAINQVMLVQYKRYEYHAFMKTRKLLRQVRQQHAGTKNLTIKSRIEKYIYVHEFNRIFMLGDFAFGAALLKRIGSRLNDFIDGLDAHSRVILYYKVACLYVGNDEHRKALEWLNRIQDETQDDLREDVISFARILSLIAHYELGNTEVMEYYIRSTYRFLLKKGDLNQYQKYILAFLRKLASGFKEDDLLPEFKRLLIKLKSLQEVRYEQRAFIYFDVISWLESKLSNSAVSKIIQHKAIKRIEAEVY